MPCYHPLTAYMSSWWQGDKLHKSISFKEDSDSERTLSLPCGRCVGCRLERSRQWAVRCMHEAQMHKSNCFITLTYNNMNCPEDYSLKYDDFQLFMKRLRSKFEHRNIYGFDEDGKRKLLNPIRFYMAGEYGESFDRPHFHACIFGLDFEDKKFFKRTSSGSNLYTSKILEELWTFGYSTVGSLTFESAAYTARYIMKKAVKSDYSPDEWKWANIYTDLETGEVIQRTPEFNKMSLKPGIGQSWIDKYMSDVYPHDHVVVGGKKCKPPRYYDNKYKEKFPEIFDMIQFAREIEGRSRSEDNTLERLAVKEKVALAKLSLLKRTID
jgi:hypothetical protein